MSNERFQQLALTECDHCLTVALTLPSDTPKVRDTHIRSVTSEVRSALQSAGLAEEKAQERAERVQQSLADYGQSGAKSIVLLQTGDDDHTFEVADELSRQVTVARSFDMTPLTSQVSPQAVRHVLALSRGEWRLYRVDGDEIAPITVEAAPANIEEANQAFEQPIEGGPQHANTSQGNGPGAPRMHRQGFGHEAPEDKRDLRYVEALDRAFQDALPAATLSVVGLSPLAALFRDHTHLEVASVVFVDPQPKSPEELRDLTAPEDDDETTFERNLSQAHSNALAVEDPVRLLEQARLGNIRVLQVPNSPVWWRDGSDKTDSEASPDGVDVVTVSIGQVLAHGGTVVRGDGLTGIQRWSVQS